jgi:hypothetical protein
MISTNLYNVHMYLRDVPALKTKYIVAYWKPKLTNFPHCMYTISQFQCTDLPSLVCLVLQQHDDGSVSLGYPVGRLPGNFRETVITCPGPILSAAEVSDNGIPLPSGNILHECGVIRRSDTLILRK